MESFFNYYELLKSTAHIQDRYVKNPDGKMCKFCGKAYPEVSFQTIPHIVPELLGKNNITSNSECDDCNANFQKYENDLSTLVQHYLGLLKKKTKNGIPTFQSLKKIGESSTTMKLHDGNVFFNFKTNSQDFKIDENSKQLTINFRTRRFTPFNVYKILLKIGISLMSNEDLISNQHYLTFLNSEMPTNNGMQIYKAFRTILFSKYHPSPVIDLYKAKVTIIDNSALPEYVLLVNFSNVVLQFFLPISNKNIIEHNPKNKLRLELNPAFILDGISNLPKCIEMKFFDLSVTDKVSITDPVVLTFDRKETE